MICSWSINKMNTLAIASILRCFQISYFSTDFQMITFRKYNKTSNQNYLDPTASVWNNLLSWRLNVETFFKSDLN